MGHHVTQPARSWVYRAVTVYSSADTGTNLRRPRMGTTQMSSDRCADRDTNGQIDFFDRVKASETCGQQEKHFAKVHGDCTLDYETGLDSHRQRGPLTHVLPPQ